jgi:hypothetical protein
MARLISREDVNALLRQRAVPAKQVTSRARSAANRRACLRMVARMGSITCADLAAAVWPNAKYANQMSQRTVRALIRSGELARRISALGTPAFVLTRPGAAFLEVRGIPARHGLDLNPAGPGFRHAAMTTRFIIEMEKLGFHGWHEYAIAQGTAPLTQTELLESYGKLPDAILTKGSLIYMVECENAPKQASDISRACGVVTRVGKRLHPDHDLEFGGLIVVFDREQNHAQRIARVARARNGE